MTRYTVHHVVVPLNGDLEKFHDTFRYLDNFTPSSYTLLGSLLTDVFIKPEEECPTVEDLLRAFWNLVELTQNGNIHYGEVPDWVMESMEVVCRNCLDTIHLTRTIYTSQHGPVPKHASVTLDRFSGYDLLMRVLILNQGYTYGHATVDRSATAGGDPRIPIANGDVL